MIGDRIRYVMLRFMKWFFVRRRLTYADFSSFVLSILVGGGGSPSS